MPNKRQPIFQVEQAPEELLRELAGSLGNASINTGLLQPPPPVEDDEQPKKRRPQ